MVCFSLCFYSSAFFLARQKCRAHICRNASPGFFGEVFRGIWNGTDVAIKVFLEQDLTTENMEDFCNEIYILRYLSHSWFTNVYNLLFFIICTFALIILLFLFSRLRHPNGKSSFWQNANYSMKLQSQHRRYRHQLPYVRNRALKRTFVFCSVVILFLGACMVPPHLSMVTEYMEMGSLYYLIHMSGQKKKLSWRRRLKIIRDICRLALSLYMRDVTLYMSISCYLMSWNF